MSMRGQMASLGLAGMAALLAACSTSQDWVANKWGPSFQVREDIGEVHVGVFPPLPLEAVRAELAEASAIDVSEVGGIATTGQDKLASAVASSLLLGLQLLPTTAAAASASAPGLPTAPATQLPALAALAASAAGAGAMRVGDAHLALNVQAGLRQHAAWLAQYIKQLELPSRKVASIVTLHVSVSPRVRNAPVNAVVDLSFLCGTPGCTRPLSVQPLLMTDNLEANLRELRARRSSGAALGLGGAAGNVAYGLSAGRSSDEESARLGHDLQGVSLVSFVDQGAGHVRLRLGAQVTPGAPNGYALLARSHVLSLLVLSEPGDDLRIAQRYHFQHVLHGNNYCSDKPISKENEGLRVLAAAASVHCAQALAGPPGERDRITHHPIPQPAPLLLPPAGVRALAQMQPDGKTVKLLLPGGSGLRADPLLVEWGVQGVWLAARSVSTGKNGRDLIAVFDRRQGLLPRQVRIAWLGEPAGDQQARTPLQALWEQAMPTRRLSQAGSDPIQGRGQQPMRIDAPYDISWLGEQAEEPAPTGVLTADVEALPVTRGRATLTLRLPAKQPVQLLLAVRGAEVASASGATLVADGIAVSAPARVELVLRNALPGRKLQVSAVRADDRSVHAPELGIDLVEAPPPAKPKAAARAEGKKPQPPAPKPAAAAASSPAAPAAPAVPPTRPASAP